MDNFIGNNINAIRLHKGLSQDQMAQAAGVSQTTISAWECGSSTPRKSNVYRIMEAISGIEFDDVMSEDNGFAVKILRSKNNSGIPTIKPTYSYAVMPVVGDIAAGDPCEAIELIDQELTVPEEFLQTHPEARFLRVRGESMNKLFQADSYVLYDPGLEVRDGDIAVVYVNGDEATVKRVYFAGDTVVLHPESTMDEFLDRAINTKDPASPPVTFAGRVIWSTWGDREVKF